MERRMLLVSMENTAHVQKRDEMRFLFGSVSDYDDEETRASWTALSIAGILLT